MGSSAAPLIFSLMFFIETGFTQDSPTSTVIVTPVSPVITGETVNLKCVINTYYSDWTYEWYKGRSDSVMSQRSERFSVNGDTLTIRGVTESDQDQYWCRGWRDSRPTTSLWSSVVSLSVMDKLRPTLSVNPQSSVLTGDSVTLSCDVGQSTGWRIHWSKDSDTESIADSTQTISSVSLSDGGEYRCRAERGGYYSHYSNTVTITVREGQISVFSILSFLLAVSPYLLATVVLLLKYYRYRVPAEDQSQNAEEETSI